MVRKRYGDDDDVRHLPVLRGTYEKLEMEAKTQGLTPSEYLERLMASPGEDNFAFYFTKKLVDQLDTEFYSRKLTRAEFLTEFLVYSGIASRMAQAMMTPAVELTEKTMDKMVDAFKTGLAVAPEKGEDRTQQLKLQMIQTVTNLVTRMLDIWTSQFSGQLHGVKTKELKEFEREEMERMGLVKKEQALEQAQVQTAPLSEFEKSLDKPTA